jgi:predicted flap endonuclease-1-like 5' DNA nuclease
MPFGIVETALVIATVRKTRKYAKKRTQRTRRRNFFKTQRQSDVALAAGALAEKLDPVVQSAADEQRVAETADSATGELERIWGIGPIYMERLHQAGVYTFTDLAKLSPMRILDIVAPADSSARPNVESWIEQAAGFINVKTYAVHDSSR